MSIVTFTRLQHDASVVELEELLAEFDGVRDIEIQSLPSHVEAIIVVDSYETAVRAVSLNGTIHFGSFLEVRLGYRACPYPRRAEAERSHELFQLRQLATVKIYKRRFEECDSTINDLSEEFLVRCFTNGLKEDIKIGVQVYNPSTMDQAKGLALLQEMTLEALEKQSKKSKNSVSTGEKEKEFTEATCAPIVRSIVKESETLAGIDNSEENDGLMSWEKRQIQENCSSLVVVKDSRIKVGGMGLQEPGIKNEDVEEDLQLGSGNGMMSKSGQATKLEPGDLARNKDNLESDLVLENHSDLVLTRDQSLVRRRHSKKKLATGKTWLHPLKLKISKHNVRQWKVHIAGSMVLYIFQIRVREPINI
ncbi:hypothetical protein Vadar_017869 [Vaccinium darrowii]|uniref:Uncharacterized protein n=1 Tax=Vaccinium darrowii TaxID=229202 RepID=A0ACB7YYI6_9ERIC|nr:hypothetical protein Vadar_017869 [Vaccinium darrowii]